MNSDDMQEIALDAALGRPSRLKTGEAKAFRKKMDDFTRKAKANGDTVHIPAEHEDISNSDR
jgi:hypothetical protein